MTHCYKLSVFIYCNFCTFSIAQCNDNTTKIVMRRGGFSSLESAQFAGIQALKSGQFFSDIPSPRKK
jgi:hypothetical protein